MKQPLAFRMRPQHLDDIIGQQHLIGEGKVLRKCLEAKRLFSMIFYGPPGTGKTTLAMVLANELGTALLRIALPPAICVLSTRVSAQ